jgi:hypothetical protein
MDNLKELIGNLQGILIGELTHAERIMAVKLG